MHAIFMERLSGYPTVEVERIEEEDPNVPLGLMIEKEEDREENLW